MPRSDSLLTVVTWNVMYEPLQRPEVQAWPQRRAAAAQLLAGCQADVIGLQEVSASQLEYLASALPDFELHTHRVRIPKSLLVRLRARYGAAFEEEMGELALLTRRASIDVVSLRHWWLSPTPGIELSTGFGEEVPRLAIVALATHRPTSLRLALATTHVDRTAPFEQTKVSASMLDRELASGRSALLLGDLNSDADPRGVQHLVTAGWADAAVDSSTWIGDSESGPARVDHVLFHSEALQLVEAAVLASPALSDHLPVRARFSIARGSSADRAVKA